MFDDYLIENCPKRLKVGIIYKRTDLGISTFYSNYDDNSLVTDDNAEVWATFLDKKLSELVNADTLSSEEFKQIKAKVEKARILNEKLEARRKEKERRQKHRKEIYNSPSTGYIPIGLNIDYVETYTIYVNRAISWTPEDSDDFLYQCRILERMVTKCATRYTNDKRPDAALGLAMAVFIGLPKWKARTDLKSYFLKYTPRMRKLVRTTCQSMVDGAVAWNNQSKLNEVNNLILSQGSDFKDWGLKTHEMLNFMTNVEITGEPVAIMRVPNKDERNALAREQRRKEAEARRLAEEEAESHSLIPLNENFEKQIFNASNIDWECHRIGSKVYNIGKNINKLIKEGKSHEAILTFLQLVKSMCRHFISDEHYAEFDDIYDPDDYCRMIFDDIKNAYNEGKVPQQDIDFLQQAWKEIEKTEAYWNYGIANYNMKF